MQPFANMTKDWTQDPRFNHFWDNYKYGQSWYSKHQISYYRSKMVSLNYENSFLYWLVQQPLQVNIGIGNCYYKINLNVYKINIFPYF
jgi:hypothetical protein